MGKEKNRQKMAHIRAHIAEPYQKRIRDQAIQIDALQKQNIMLTKQNDELAQKLHEAEYQIEKLDEWLERMQEYVNMSDDELQKMKEQLDADTKIRTSLATLMDVFCNPIGMSSAGIWTNRK